MEEESKVIAANEEFNLNANYKKAQIESSLH
jgi:hypothetical protein